MSNYSQIYAMERKLAFSTTTPLGAAGVYTSPTIDMINYKASTYLATSDVAGSLFLQYSDDGVTWINSATAATTLGAGSVVGASGANAFLRYYRIVFTNGAAAQTSFKLSSYLSPL